mmetsp:Transcript_28142/g.34363  ORF Transcript_28142/g.34363 Transcript_28142/m.34363 type:complete len:211 (-) Transcript_28142:368-1000(-)
MRLATCLASRLAWWWVGARLLLKIFARIVLSRVNSNISLRRSLHVSLLTTSRMESPPIILCAKIIRTINFLTVCGRTVIAKVILLMEVDLSPHVNPNLGSAAANVPTLSLELAFIRASIIAPSLNMHVTIRVPFSLSVNWNQAMIWILNVVYANRARGVSQLTFLRHKLLSLCLKRGERVCLSQLTFPRHKLTSVCLKIGKKVCLLLPRR